MTIKNEDLQLLVRIENFLGTNFPRGSEGQDLAWKLCSLNEKLIMQRNEQRGKTANAIKERRKENPDYARPERERKLNKMNKFDIVENTARELETNYNTAFDLVYCSDVIYDETENDDSL